MFCKKKLEIVEFYPEINLFTTQSNDPNAEVLNIRVASGDANNINKSLKIKSADIQEISISVDGFGAFSEPVTPNTSKLYCTGSSKFIVKRFDGSTEVVPMADHKIEVLPTSQSKKGTTWPDIETVRKEITDILQDEFGAALDDYQGLEEVVPQSSDKFSFSDLLSFHSVIIGVSILITVIAIGVIAYKKSAPPTIPKETLYAAAQENLKNMSQAGNAQQSLDDEVLQEFNLQKGIDLDK